MVPACSILVAYACMLQARSVRIYDPHDVNTADEETAVVPFRSASETNQGGPTSPNDPNMPIKMRDEEKALLEKLLSKATSYVEFGAGGSTVLATSFDNLKRIDVVESDPDWVEGLQKRHDIQKGVKTGKLNFHLVDIGRTGAWGFPKDQSEQGKWHAYPDAGADVVKSSGTDLVLVDGRFRVACFLKALKASKPQTIIAIHDYVNVTACKYTAVAQFAEVIEHEKKLWVFRRKEKIDKAELEHAIDKHEHDVKRLP